VLEGTEDAADNEVIGQFIKQFYSEAASVPPQVLLPNEVEEAQIIEQWLRTRRSGQAVGDQSPAPGAVERADRDGSRKR